jgi:hypothetical protein
MNITKRQLPRRSILRGAGAVLALPWLDAMVPAFATRAQAAAVTQAPRRFMAMNHSLGFHGPFFFPKSSGANYELSPYLTALAEHRNDFTVFSGLSHDDQNGADGHSSQLTWLTGGRHPGLPGSRNNISLDQFLAEKLRPDTRFPSLVLSNADGDSCSWTSTGVNIPAENSVAKLFQQLFIAGTPSEVQSQIRELKRGRSILDTVGEGAKRMRKELGTRDQDRFDQYLAGVRDLEQRLIASESWATKPKPVVDAKPMVDIPDINEVVARNRLMHDLITLALQTDSTRFVTYRLGGGFKTKPKLDGVSNEWHYLSHHGLDEKKIEELSIIEKAELVDLNRLLGLLKGMKEGDSTLLDQTTVLVSSNLGNASAHSARDLPVIVAGGGFKHGQHVVAGGPGVENTRFCNLFVQIARQMGVETEAFSQSNASSVKGFEARS